MDTIEVRTAVATRDQAQRIAQDLIESRLAACVQIVGPIESHYRWQGKIETSEEWLLLIKTRQPLYAQLEEKIRQLHPYETPEILAVPVVEGASAYLKWMQGELLGES